MMRAGTASRAMSAVAVSAALLSIACTAGNRPPQPSSSSDPPRPDPVVLEREPRWRGSTGRNGGFSSTEVRGDSLLVFGSTYEETGRQLLVVDLESGTTRWRLDHLKDLPGSAALRLGSQWPYLPVAGAGNDWTVFVSYRTDDEQSGVAALSGADGSVKWKSPVRVSPSRHEVLAANDRVVVSGARTPNTPEGTQVFAIDSVTGRRLWNASGIWPQFVIGDTVLAQAGDRIGESPDHSTPSRGATVIGLDARTGRRKWDLGSRYPDSKVFMAVGDFAVISQVSTTTRDKRTITVVDGESGDRIAELADVTDCLNDRESLVICDSATSGEAVVFDAVRRETRRISDPRFPQEAWHGYLLLGDNRILDRSGEVVAGSLPGAVIAMSEDYVVLSDRARGEYGVYRRTR